MRRKSSTGGQPGLRTGNEELEVNQDYETKMKYRRSTWTMKRERSAEDSLGLRNGHVAPEVDLDYEKKMEHRRSTWTLKRECCTGGLPEL